MVKLALEAERIHGWVDQCVDGPVEGDAVACAHERGWAFALKETRLCVASPGLPVGAAQSEGGLGMLRQRSPECHGERCGQEHGGDALTAGLLLACTRSKRHTLKRPHHKFATSAAMRQLTPRKGIKHSSR